ncbi:MAG TPA: hypothetical protein VGJ79_14745 [Candidatus Dormibacteraeota bacterium]|jgi:hypothetical protein
MRPLYVKKASPKDRVTWMDKFIALEPRGGVRDVIEIAHRNCRARAVFDAIVDTAPWPVRVRV